MKNRWRQSLRRAAVAALFVACALSMNQRSLSARGSSLPQGLPDQAQRMVNSDVIRLVAAGLSEEVVATAVDQAAVWDFDLSPEGLISLKKAGLSDKLILVMQRKGASNSRGVAPSEKGALSKWRGPLNGFRDLTWGDRLTASLDRLGSLGRMESYSRRGDDTRVAGVPARLITYNYWQNRLCQVQVSWWVDASRRAVIGEQLASEWGPSKATSLRVPDRPIDKDFPEWLSQDGRTYAELRSIDYLNDRDYPGASRPVSDRHLWSLLIEEQKCAKEARGGAGGQLR